jgi:hypothetical protein
MSDAAPLAGGWGCKEEMTVNSFVGSGFLFVCGGGTGIGGNGDGFKVGSAGLMLGPVAAAEGAEVVLGAIVEAAKVFGVLGWISRIRVQGASGLLGNRRGGVV